MTAEQKQLAQTSERTKPLAANENFVICGGGDRDGRREYFAAAAIKNSKRSETEMQPLNNYDRLTGRFAATLATLIGALFLAAITSG